MADVTNELIYQVLKGIQDPLSKIEDSQRDIREELIGVRLHMHAMQGEINNILSRTSAIESRLPKSSGAVTSLANPRSDDHAS